MKRKAPAELQEALGHQFASPDLLVRALTHASVAGARGRANYERLEFLGDRVLGLVIADMLDLHFPQSREGDLSKRLARLVSGGTCAAVATEMGLGDFIRTGGPGNGQGRLTASVLGDACEAVLGALYRDAGIGAARAVIERYWRPRLESMSGPLRDAKTELQEWAHRKGFEIPTYTELQRSGPDHALHFEIEVTVGLVPPARGRGKSKREAEHDAASTILRREGVWDAS